MKILKKLFILMLVSRLVLTGQVNASSASDYSDEITLRLKAGMITEAEFSEKITNVTKSAASDMLQIETLGNRIFLLPRENLESQLYVITQDNVSYCLHLIMDEAQAPTRIKIKKPYQKINEEQANVTANTVELMKALLTGRQPAGAVSSRLHPQEIFNNGKFRIVIDEAYEFSNNVKALVLTFENLDHKPLVVPIEHIELPGLLAISIDSQILEAKPYGTNKKHSSYATKAYMIVEGLTQ
ncbi:MAG: type-F conjugative transfer system secretin TraK [Candidatus Omnitrophica bacterium]|nr:type-F conjugative transfer system secretin TraK [Candidatus Omnitrophota bacterium]